MADLTTWLEPGKQLTVTAPDGTSGTLARMANQDGGGDDISSETVVAGGTVVKGPYTIATRWKYPNTFTVTTGSGSGLASDGSTHSYPSVPDGAHALPREVFGVYDDFVYQTLAEADTPWVLSSGSNATAIDPAVNAQEGGVVRLTSGVAGTGVAADGSQLACHIPMQADSGGLVFETRLHINAAVTTVQVVAGFTDVTTLELPAAVGGSDAITTTASNAVVFVFDTDADTDEWFGIGVNGDTDATGNGTLGVVPVADTYQTLRIEVDSDGATARFFIDGTEQGSLTANATSASTNLHATVLVNSTTTTSRTVDVDYIYAGHNR